MVVAKRVREARSRVGIGLKEREESHESVVVKDAMFVSTTCGIRRGAARNFLSPAGGVQRCDAPSATPGMGASPVVRYTRFDHSLREGTAARRTGPVLRRGGSFDILSGSSVKTDARDVTAPAEERAT